MTSGAPRWLGVLVAVFGLASCSARSAPVAAPSAAVALRDTHENLNAVLWMQTATEYEMAAEGAYARAIDLLAAGLVKAQADPAWSAATEQKGDLSRLPPAVIMDVDETVLDNGRYQGQQALVRAGAFDPKKWDDWVGLARAPAVPGAKGFVAFARSRKVRVFYVTSRTVAEKAKTLENLRAALDPEVAADDVLTNGEKDPAGEVWSGARADKTYRRAFIAERYRILLLAGDDLRDFVSADRKTIAERREIARAFTPYWRNRWVILPNPTYGSWEGATSGNDPALDDAGRLRAKWHLVEGIPPQ